MTLKEKVAKVDYLLKRDFPNVETPLVHKDAFTLLIAVALSAQTLDSTVNKVTPNLWTKYPTIKDLANADVKDVEPIIRLTNFYKNKSRNIIALAQTLISNYDSRVPNKMEDLILLPGIGRKTANVVINQWFAKGKEKGIPASLPEGFVVDTHVKRVAKRLGLTKNIDPVKVEQDLMKLFPQAEWDDVGLRMIYHGRLMCTARNPKCILDSEWSKICGCVKEVKLKN
jgi:endonuclease III